MEKTVTLNEGLDRVRIEAQRAYLPAIEHFQCVGKAKIVRRKACTVMKEIMPNPLPGCQTVAISVASASHIATWLF